MAAVVDLTVNGQTREGLSLRRAIFDVARAAINAGDTPESLSPFLTKDWAVYDGTLDSKAMRSCIPEHRHRRFFLDDADLFHVAGKTYAFTREWGQPEWGEAMKAIAGRHPGLAMTWHVHGELQGNEANDIERTFLVNASPGPWGTQELSKRILDHREGKEIVLAWRGLSTSQLRKGDRLVWQHGTEPKGIVATGRVREIRSDNEILAVVDEIVSAAPEQILPNHAVEDLLAGLEGGPAELSEDAAISLEERWQTHLLERDIGPIRLISSADQLRENMMSFVRAVMARSELIERPVVQPDNWVFDATTKRFAPSKWCAFRGMTAVTYEALLAVQKLNKTARGFDGSRAKRHLEKMFDGEFLPNLERTAALQDWLVTNYGKGSSSTGVKFLTVGTSSETSSPTQGQGSKGMSSDLNLIYYGPPGTGKTYTTARKAVEIVDGAAPEDRLELMERYRALREQGVIEFVTFHQSYSYEEFVEGIRPVIDDDEDDEVGGDVRYECKRGVFVRFCLEADAGTGTGPVPDVDPSETQIWKMSLGNTKVSAEASVYDQCIANNYVLLGYGHGLDFAGCDTWEAVLTRFRTKKPDAEDDDFNVTTIQRFKNEMKVGDLVVVSDGNHKFRAIARVTGPYKRLNQQEYGQMRPVEWLFVAANESLPCETIYDRQFSQQTIYKLSSKQLHLAKFRALLAPSKKQTNRVLIIDEINRGNIAKIMGELITLIEPDKRSGAVNELRVTLPYSNRQFVVPNNVYIIGTMNTADRSIALLDSALRRRFRFIEMEPDPAVLKATVGVIDGIDVGVLLETLNHRIELVHDRDHTLGHAYFIGCKSLDDVRDALIHRVLPLLQEYFHDHWERICMVLGCPHDDAGKCSTNANPIIRARPLSAAKLLGPSPDIDDCLRYEVSEAFSVATGAKLAPFFHGLMTIKSEAPA